jgi:hypothetical protein
MVHTYAAPMNATAATLMRTAAQPAIAFRDYLGDLLCTSASSKPVRHRASPQVLRNGSISPTKG